MVVVVMMMKLKVRRTLNLVSASSDVCGGLAPSLLSGDVPEAAVSPSEGT